jgi:hypothetical protein
VSEAAVAKFIGAIAIHMPRHRAETDAEKATEKLWFKDMVAMFKNYSDSVLERAATRIVRSESKDRRFPLPAACMKACEEIIKLDRAEATPRLDDKSRAPAQMQSEYDRKYANADWLITQSPMGKQAAREGWILSLHDFIRQNDRLPVEKHEIDRCKASAKGFDEAFAKCVRGEAGMLSKSLLGLGEAMLKRRHKLEDMILHGVIRERNTGSHRKARDWIEAGGDVP